MKMFFTGLGLILLLWFFALLYLRNLVRRRTSPDHILTLLQEEVHQLEADIDEKTEQNLQLLEEKIQSLRELCAEANRRITVYSRELERRGREEGFALLNRTFAETPAAGASAAVPPGDGKKRGKRPKAPARPPKEGPGLLREPSPPKHALLEGLEIKNPAVKAAESAYRVQTGRPAVPEPPRKENVLAENPPEADSGTPGPDSSGPLRITLSREINPKPPVKDRIAELHRAGFSPELIAERLGLTLGEIKLYIALADGAKPERKPRESAG